jgi:Family of unknown function (DUF6632)
MEASTNAFPNADQPQYNLQCPCSIHMVGLIFLALAYPLVIFVRQEPALSMMFSLYVTLGIFLLLAIRNPSGSRNLIAFTAWSSFAHAGVMGWQAYRHMIPSGELVGVAVTQKQFRRVTGYRQIPALIRELEALAPHKPAVAKRRKVS